VCTLYRHVVLRREVFHLFATNHSFFQLSYRLVGKTKCYSFTWRIAPLGEVPAELEKKVPGTRGTFKPSFVESCLVTATEAVAASLSGTGVD
jgi:hypothetical protein